MSIIYTRLGEVALRHDFYRDGLAKDMILMPSPETAQLMKNGKILFRKTPGGIVLLYRAEEDEITPLTPVTLPQSFFFFFKPENPAAFLQVTDLDNGSEEFQAGKLPFFRNTPVNASTASENPEELSYQLLDGLRPKAFSLQLTLDPTPASVRIKVRNAAGEIVSAGKDSTGNPLPDGYEMMPDQNGLFRILFDLKGRREGVYTFTLRNSGDTDDLWSKKYWLGESSSSQPFGLIELRFQATPNHLYGATEFYQVSFSRKESRWTYYVVNGNKKVDLVTTQLRIQDLGNVGSVPYGSYTFDQIGTSPSAEVKINNLDTVVFRSQNKIPYFEIPKLNFQLRRTPGNQILIPNLPNPSRSAPTKQSGGEANSEIYVFI
ncbi:hypothetical protein [Algoriphagus yeomjeoni]|uniref:Uncharacterized protein n=1 Tax=Algoriphagus yeomjeoni TaxID=291403 RepID=A0A327NXS8_9BACT|nr:hypothetical protein [Algoriphagus yeomjeoni]RAI84829.1 hypothetical protein LV83_03877 [Algoriphagus yeomjeoni]